MKQSGRMVRHVGAAVVAVAAVVVPGAAEARTAWSPRAGRRSAFSEPLQEVVRTLVAAGAPGALAVVRTPRGIRRAAEGFAQLKPGVRLRATDRYRIASVTKPFTATIVMQLVAERRLGLSDPVERWLPGKVPNGQAITLRQLLNHTSGLFDYDADEAWIRARVADPGRTWSPLALVAVATSHPPLFAPGTSWSYSNTNYVLLGLVVQAVTGRPLDRELRRRIFEPLSLGATSYPKGTVIEGRVTHGYVGSASSPRIPRGTLVDATSILSPSAWGAGQIVSNGDDVTAFLAALMRGRLLRASLLAAMKTRVPGHGYGLGLIVADTPCGRVFGHDGDVPGYRNIVWATADGKHVAAVMVNIDTTRVSWSRLRAAAASALCST